jgi:calnexin
MSLSVHSVQAVFTNNTFQIYVDRSLAYEGNLLTSLTPAINPEESIPDPTDTKPPTWDDRPTIPDPNARKPDWWYRTLPVLHHSC